MPPTEDQKYTEFGEHGRRTYENLTKDRALTDAQKEIAKEIARLADIRSVLNNLSTRYSRQVYDDKKVFPDVVCVRNLYEVERRSDDSTPDHRTVAAICALLSVTEDMSVDEVSKAVSARRTELVASLENIVQL